MFVLVKVALAIALALGGTGATALASQNSLPNEALYPVKLLTEDIRLGLANQPSDQINLELEFAAVRTREMVQLADRGQAIPEAVPVRLQTHLNTALQATAQLGEPQMMSELEQIRARVQAQLQIMNQARSNTPADVGLRQAEQVMTRTRQMAELGLNDPVLFRERITNNRPDTAPVQPEMTPGAGNGNGQQPENAPSGPAYGPGSQPENTPPGSGYGPGPQPQNTPQGPAYGPGPQPENTPVPNGYGPGPQGNTPQGPSSGPGPGPQNTPQGMQDGTGPQATCTPMPNDNGNGPGPEQTSQPGGDGGGSSGGGDSSGGGGGSGGSGGGKGP